MAWNVLRGVFGGATISQVADVSTAKVVRHQAVSPIALTAFPYIVDTFPPYPLRFREVRGNGRAITENV